MKLGKIYDYRNKEEARKLIGKKVLADDILFKLESQNKCYIYTLTEIKDSSDYPFVVDSMGLYQFIREIEEDEPMLMSRRQLAEWVARGFGQIKVFSDVWMSFNYCLPEGESEDDAVDEKYTIRPWGSDEWVEPTVDIYERDCKGIMSEEDE